MKIVTIGDSSSAEGPAGSGTSPKSVSTKIEKKSLSFNSFDVNENGEPNQSLVRGKAVCEAITELLVNNKGKLGQPFILCLNGNTGTGKTMFIDIIKSRLLAEGISCIDKRYDKYLLMEHELSDTMKSDVIFIDDLFNDVSKLTDIDKGSAHKESTFDILYIVEFLVAVVKQNKILIVSSSFPFKEILEYVYRQKRIGIIADEIKDFLSSVSSIELKRKQSYRKLLATKSNILLNNLIKPIRTGINQIVAF